MEVDEFGTPPGQATLGPPRLPPLSRLTVPPDGLCLTYCALAARDPEGWQRLLRDENGFLLIPKQEKRCKQMALNFLSEVVNFLIDRGEGATAERLLAGGYPGTDEFQFYAQVLGGAIKAVLQMLKWHDELHLSDHRFDIFAQPTMKKPVHKD